ncbi:MAG: TRAM domain-containing protein, partial [Candidatus Binataceae bacterium]
RRIAAVISLQETMSLERNRATIGRTYPILIEGPARRGIGLLAGKTPQFKTAVFPSAYSVAVGETIPVRIDSANGHTLTGSIVRQ